LSPGGGGAIPLHPSDLDPPSLPTRGFEQEAPTRQAQRLTPRLGVLIPPAPFAGLSVVPAGSFLFEPSWQPLPGPTAHELRPPRRPLFELRQTAPLTSVHRARIVRV